MKHWLFLIILLLVLMLVLYLNLAAGDHRASMMQIWAAINADIPADYKQAVIMHQRLPRSLIAIYTGAMMAVSGLIFQGLVRNPLASSSTMGVNAGATMFTLIAALFLQLSIEQQGLAALLGGFFGFVCCLSVARLAGGNSGAHGLMLILSGTLIAMLFSGISSAILLGFPTLRMDYLPWLTGNINHVYSDRLYQYFWIGLIAFIILLSLSRPLTLILLGEEKARSAGVNAVMVSRIGLLCAIVGASSAVAICGPIGFVGLIVPHIIRPIIGQNFIITLPASALTGAVITLIGDIGARNLFLPYVLHTGVVMDFLGGLAFIWIIRRYYISNKAVRVS